MDNNSNHPDFLKFLAATEGGNTMNLSRREFLAFMGMTIAAGGLAGMSVTEAMAQPIEKLAENVPTRILGRTGWESKIIGTLKMFRR